jgi:hypothetical protein
MGVHFMSVRLMGVRYNSCADLNALSFWMVNVTDSLTY